jgi:hypothetical protein
MAQADDHALQRPAVDALAGPREHAGDSAHG